MSTLVECVPNFSEGRDKAKVDAIIDAMKMPGVYLLDREMDSDHNRCVITLVGEREAIQEAAIRGVGKASELIDLNVHTGAHPRMGAADVVPFIPIDGVTIEDCVAMACHVGEQIWKRYQIPVYLYEAAARIPERQGLENIRRGQFEGIVEPVWQTLGDPWGKFEWADTDYQRAESGRPSHRKWQLVPAVCELAAALAGLRRL
jgi:glutamate formiminotransferase